jgi:hypothetical protein
VSAASNARWVLAVAPKLFRNARQITKATPSIARLNTGWARKNSTQGSPLEDELPPLDELRELLQELDEREPDERELELELCEPL